MVNQTNASFLLEQADSLESMAQAILEICEDTIDLKKASPYFGAIREAVSSHFVRGRIKAERNS